MVGKEQNINMPFSYNKGLSASLNKLMRTTTITLRNFDILLMLGISSTRHLYAWSEDFSHPCSVSESAKVIPNFIHCERKDTLHRKSKKAKESSKLLRSNLQALLIQCLSAFVTAAMKIFQLIMSMALSLYFTPPLFLQNVNLDICFSIFDICNFANFILWGSDEVLSKCIYLIWS